MTRKRQLSPAETAFIAELFAYWEHCGSPPYNALVKASGPLHLEEGLPSLSKAAISEIRHGHRLPSAAWLASFIRCCHEEGFRVGKFTTHPGKDGLPEWQEKLKAAKRAGRAPQPHTEETTPAEAAATDAQSFRPSAADENAVVAGFTLPAAEREYVAGQRSYGRTLLAELDRTVSPEAVYRVAVILAASEAYGKSGASLLMGPATTNHPDAIALMEAEDAGPGPFRAAVGRRAGALGAEALADGDLEAAIVFHGCAVRCGSLESAVELAAVLLTLDGDHLLAEDIRAANRTPHVNMHP